MKMIKVVALATIFVLVPITLIADAEVSHETQIEAQEKTLDNQITLLASKHGQDELVAREIIRCESKWVEDATGLNFEASSTVPWSKDHGWWQINDYYHEKEALRAGFDIHNKWQNLEYGFILMKKYGTQPWSASRHCWQK